MAAREVLAVWTSIPYEACTTAEVLPICCCSARAAMCVDSTELVLDAAVPLPGSKAEPKLLQKAGVKMNFKF